MAEVQPDDGLGEEQFGEEQPDDSGLVRHLRRQLKDQASELAELRALQDAGSGDDAAPEWAKRLRQQNLRLKRELQEAQAASRGRALRAAFDAANVPDTEVRDLLGARFDDPAAATPEAVHEAMLSLGVQPVDEVAWARSEAIRRTDELRAGAIPVGSQRMDFQDYKRLTQTSPAEAANALVSGQVDLPPYIAAALAANQAEKEQMGGLFGE